MSAHAATATTTTRASGGSAAAARRVSAGAAAARAPDGERIPLVKLARGEGERGAGNDTVVVRLMRAVDGQHELRPRFNREQRDVFRLNNQSTTFMHSEFVLRLESDGGTEEARTAVYVLLHDNRLFYFSKRALVQPVDGTEADAEDVRLDPLELESDLLMLLTTPFYRLMSLVYVLFKLLDNGAFITLIVNAALRLYESVGRGGDDGQLTPSSGTGNGGSVFDGIEPGLLVIFTVIGIELVFDIIDFVTRVWLLKRSEFAFALFVYAAYFSAFVYAELDTIWFVVLGGRLAAFLLEEAVDYCFDRLIHDDIVRGRVGQRYRDLYLGSMCVWWYSRVRVRSKSELRSGTTSPSLYAVLLAIPFFLACVLVLLPLVAALTVVALAALVFYVAVRCVPRHCIGRRMRPLPLHDVAELRLV